MGSFLDPGQSLGRSLVVLGVGVCAVSTVCGQSVLVALEKDGPRPVLAYRDADPMVERDGELRKALSRRYSFQKAAAYGPGLVEIDRLQIRSRHLEFVGTTGSFNYTLIISGKLGSDVPLRNCFLVLEITEGKDQGFLGVEIPDIDPDRDVTFDRRLPLHAELRPKNVVLHIFSEGLERLHTRMPKTMIAEQRINTEKFLLRDVENRPPAPSHVVQPSYPVGAEGVEGAGSAKVRCRIDERGAVAEAEVIEASHPAFGEAAVEAVRQWAFEPAVKDHRYVQVSVVVPFEFTAPQQGTREPEAEDR